MRAAAVSHDSPAEPARKGPGPDRSAVVPASPCLLVHACGQCEIDSLCTRILTDHAFGGATAPQFESVARQKGGASISPDWTPR